MFECNEVMKKCTNMEPLLERSLYLLMLFFMADIKEKMLDTFEKKPLIWWRYIDDIFFIWEHDEESLEIFIGQINMFHPTIID